MLSEKERAQTAARQQRFRQRQQQARRREQEAKGLPAMPTIATIPGHARWRAALESAHGLIAQVHDEMQNYYDDRSEQWQESEKAEAFAERLEAVEAVEGQLKDLTLEIR